MAYTLGRIGHAESGPALAHWFVAFPPGTVRPRGTGRTGTFHPTLPPFSHRPPDRRQVAAALPLVRLPGARTLGRWLRRLNLVPRRVTRAAYAVWTMDFKGWFRTTDGTRVEPLTVGIAKAVSCSRPAAAQSARGPRPAGFDRRVPPLHFAPGHPCGQRPALCRVRATRAVEAFHLLAALGDRGRVRAAGLSRGQRGPRADARRVSGRGRGRSGPASGRAATGFGTLARPLQPGASAWSVAPAAPRAKLSAQPAPAPAPTPGLEVSVGLAHAAGQCGWPALLAGPPAVRRLGLRRGDHRPASARGRAVGSAPGS